MSSPFTGVPDASTVNINAELLLQDDEFAFATISSNDASSDSLAVVCDENNNDPVSFHDASHISTESDDHDENVQETSIVSPEETVKTVKTRKWRSKSVPRLSFEDPKSETITNPQSPKSPGVGDIILNWSSSSGDYDVTKPGNGDSNRQKRFSCPIEGSVNRNNRRASLPISGTTTLKLLYSVCNILDPEMMEDFPQPPETSTVARSHGREGESRTFLPFLAAEDAAPSDLGIVDLGQSCRATLDPSQPMSCMTDAVHSDVDVVVEHVQTHLEPEYDGAVLIPKDTSNVSPKTVRSSRPINIVTPLRLKNRSDTYREALVLEDDTLIEEKAQCVVIMEDDIEVSALVIMI
jgi:hypothetical protein